MENDILNTIKNKNGIPMTTSRAVAEYFDRSHKSILNAIDTTLEAMEDDEYSRDFGRHNIVPSSYTNSQNKKQREYLLTKKGFTTIALGLTGPKAIRLRMMFVEAFEAMEEFIKTREISKLDTRKLTDAIKKAYANPPWYHYSNELDMINIIVTGYTAKQIREQRGIGKSAPVRDYLTPKEMHYLDKLMTYDVILLENKVWDFYKRKDLLITYHNNICATPVLVETLV